MAKVFCASSECIHNKSGLCRAKGINLADKHMHTVNEGFKHLHLCKTYEESEDSKKYREFINKIFNKKEVGWNENNRQS